MKLREWNARLHGLVVFRSLLDDPVVAKFADLTDRMEAGAPGCGPVCDAVAQFEAALFEHTTNWGSYLSAAVLEAETVCVRQAASGTLAPALQTALDSELAFLQALCGLTLDELLAAAGSATGQAQELAFLPRWETSGIDLPAEPKQSLYYTADRMGPVELASCAFGQSSKISYLEMAAAVCAVVNGGKLMQPYVVSEILAPDGNTIEQLSPVCKRQVLKAETSQTMREMMEAVVLHGGGRNAQISGYRVGGKSGTSQKLDSADEKARIASFVAVAPIDDPQFLCLVCLDEPHSWTTAGGSLSAPVCAEVLEQTLVYEGIPRAAVPDTPASDAETSADLPEDGDSFDGA